MSILPVTAVGLDYPVGTERISSGIARLDTMLGGKGYFRGTTVLISGTAGTGKSSLAAKFAESVCSRGDRCLYFAFEESAAQIIRNMSSISIDLATPVKKGLLKFHASRPSMLGLEAHLVTIHSLVTQFKPRVVIIDPISNLSAVGSDIEVKAMLTRLFDYLKQMNITTLSTNLTHAGSQSQEQTETEISSLIDTWILLRDIEINGERNRGLYILKSRGMAHSNQIRELVLSSQGINLIDVYLGPGGVLTGSARAAQEAREKAETMETNIEKKRRAREAERRRKVLEAKIEALRAEYDSEMEEIQIISSNEKLRREEIKQDRADMARLRKADLTSSPARDLKTDNKGVRK